ncbi:MAG TPA: NifB/NifX family molybdenum-iron cluster-binding protein [Methanomassiliicoccales archaeon]|nr:NifB/NifX family molybdenum-iron cluster-binding protein [Methanomassiliicoccales archaeon]
MTSKKRSAPHADRPCRMAVTSKGEGLDGEIAPMARSNFFIIFEGNPENRMVMENLVRKGGSESAVRSAAELAKQKVDIVITGTIGPRAFKQLESAGVKVHAGCDGKVSDILEKCLKGKLPVCKKATYGGYLGT